MKTVADLWPLFVTAGFAFCAYAVIRLARRFSPGAVSAGPKTPPASLIKGQTEAAEDLRTIEKRLDTRPGSMIQRIEASCLELGVPVDGITSGTSPEHHIDQLLHRLEAHLGIDFAQQAGFEHDVLNQPASSVPRETEGLPT